MKKAALVLASLLALVLILAACGGGGSTTTEETAGGAAPAESEEAEGGGAENEAEPEGEEAGGGGGGSTVQFEANPSGALEFEEESATAESGKDTIDLTNESSEPHNVTIEDSSGKVLGETETFAEGTGSAVVELKPGTYTFFCSVPGHREAGMEGTLTVK